MANIPLMIIVTIFGLLIISFIVRPKGKNVNNIGSAGINETNRESNEKNKFSIIRTFFLLFIIFGFLMIVGSNPTEEEHFRKINYSLNRTERGGAVMMFGKDWEKNLIQYNSFGIFSYTKYKNEELWGNEVISIGIMGNVYIINTP